MDSLEWSSITHVYGPAVEIPDLLHKLRASALEIREHSYQQLMDLLVHQGSRYEASAVVAPFLIEIVGDDDAPDRSVACQVLAGIAVGDESSWLVDKPDLPAMRQQVRRRAGMSVAELKEEEAAWVAAARTDDERAARAHTAKLSDVRLLRDYERWAMEAYDAVRAGVSVYLRALRSASPALRLYDAHLLAWFPEDGGTIGPSLARLLTEEEDPNIAATACVAAGLCGVPGDQDLIGALARRRDSQNHHVRWSAALALARLDPYPDRALIEELYTCLFEADRDNPYWPFLNGDMATMAALTISGLGPDVAPDRIEILGGRLSRQPRAQDAFLLVRALLDAAFPDGPLPDGIPFDGVGPDQRNAVLALQQNPSLLEGAMISMLLGRYNLPRDRRALRSWCSR